MIIDGQDAARRRGARIATRQRPYPIYNARFFAASINTGARFCSTLSPSEPCHLRQFSRVWPLLACLAALALALLPSTAVHATDTVDPQAAQNYQQLAHFVSSSRIALTMQTLSSFGSRVPGYPGHDKARDYLISQLGSIVGPTSVHTEDFQATVPFDDGSSRIAVGSKSYQVWPMWPNLVRTCTLPPGGVTGPLIYAGAGDLPSFNGKTVMGSVVMLDFNCGTSWLNAARLGAKAILFVEPQLAMRGEAESKFVGIPANIPRFWISTRDAAALQAAALTTPNVTATVTCNNPFKLVPATNIIATVQGTDPTLAKQQVIIESYYDSMSIVPALAPGAEAASGPAAILELARAFKADPPKRSIIFVLTDAHGLGLQGMRTFIDKHVDEWLPISGWDHFVHSVFGQPLPVRQEVWLSTSIDISSQSAEVGGFYKGTFYDYREDVQSQFAEIGRALSDNAGKIGQTLGFDPTTRFADGINPLGGKSWRNFLPSKFGFDGEVATLAGGKGITFATCDDARQLVDTPADTFTKINVSNITQQVTLLACEYWDLLNDTNDADSLPVDSNKGVMPVPKYPSWTRQGLQLGMSTLTGRTLLFDPLRNFVPSTPVPDSIALFDTLDKTYTGVRGNIAQMVGPDARFNFVAMPLVTSQAAGMMFQGTSAIEAFHFDSTNDDRRGEIDYAPDEGVNGAFNYPVTFSINNTKQTCEIVLFKCVATSIFDLVDQSNLQSLNSITILDGVSNSVPREYGADLSLPDPASSYIEDLATIYSTPQTRLKILMSSGPVATRFVLLNPKDALTEKDAEGQGYNVADPNDPTNPPGFLVNGLVTYTPLRVAHDMWTLDEFRINQLAKYRIVNDEMNTLHSTAKTEMAQAQQALAQKNYALFDSYAREAWGYEARVYPRAQQTASDVVMGVLFYLFLMIPFAFFMERLFVSSTDLNRQLLWTFGIFLVVFLIFAKIHPAFDITGNPSIVLIAFVMLALSMLVVFLIWGKFEEQMKSMSTAMSGVHKIEVGKAGIAFAAFALGISNMRRRKIRTVLTCITLILLTFTVLSFTSIVNTIRYNQVAAPGTPLYNGILLRSPVWDPLQDTAYQALNDSYGTRYTVAPRAWYYGGNQSQQTFLTVKRADQSVDVKGVNGLAPEEARVTHPQDDLMAGRWFEPGDNYVTILPDALATALGVSNSDVGRVSVTYSGQDFLVVGIIDGKKLNALKDLDDEQLSPVDFISSNQQGQSSGSGSGGGSSAGFSSYQHIDPENTLIIPYETLINLGGGLRSVAINFGDAKTTREQLQSLMPRLDLNLYAGIANSNYRFSAIGSTSGKGLGSVVIPILIAALIVLNTMLSSVFERVREIAIFSSVGLSPSNIAMLFIAEALVYAVIGAVAGYLLGQGLSKLITVLHLLPGLYLNFSSTSAVLSTMIVVVVVLGSTLYPARKASEVATPNVERAWKLPDPDGDHWKIGLPFAITGDQAVGVNAYLAEWFQSYEEQSVGEFLTQGVKSQPKAYEHGEGHELSGRIWLAPFDLGVSQDITLGTIPTEIPDVFEVWLNITRVSGDVSNWKRVNRRFLNVVRQQFLIWRTLTEEQRERYMLKELAEDDISIAVDNGKLTPTGDAHPISGTTDSGDPLPAT